MANGQGELGNPATQLVDVLRTREAQSRGGPVDFGADQFLEQLPVRLAGMDDLVGELGDPLLSIGGNIVQA
jgi:hypothetical protein